MKVHWKVNSATMIGALVASVASAQLTPKALYEFRDKMRAGYGSISVTQKAKQLQISLDVPKVSESTYTTALAVACVHLGAHAKQLTEIAVLNKFSAQGYVYESPNRCESVANESIQKVRIVILSATHSY